MIDEVLEVREYLEKKKMLREDRRSMAAYYIARWYAEEGYSFREIRDAVFKWAKESGNYLVCDVNSIVDSAIKCKDRLTDTVVVKVSETDVNRIVKRFDGKNIRLVALGLLCYAKVHADSNGEFDLSLRPFSDWIGKDRGTIMRRWLPEIEALEYAERKNGVRKFNWRNKKSSRVGRAPTRMHMLVPIRNTGQYILNGNDIRGLYNEIFGNTKRDMFNLPTEYEE